MDTTLQESKCLHMIGPTRYEVELKIPVRSLGPVSQRLQQLGATRRGTVTHMDEYYAHPCRSFQQTDEALRLRASFDGVLGPDAVTAAPSRVTLTYKGPRIGGRSKTRTEFDVGVTDMVSARSILLSLGFKHIATVTKHRTLYVLGDSVVTLDTVPELGSFVELERVVGTRPEVDVVLARLAETAQELGLDPSAAVRDSYLEMLLRR